MTRNYYIATISYIFFIVLINAFFVDLPGVAAFGQSFSSADMLVGIIYLVRDFAQREIKHFIIVAMIIAGALSFVLANKEIAIASVSAFFVGESIDWAIYTFTKKPLSQRLVWSSSLSAPVDSMVFLYVANRLHIVPMMMMTLGKLSGVLLLWAVWKWRRQKKLQLIDSLQ